MDNCVSAQHIVKGKEKIDTIEGKYVILYDIRTTVAIFENLSKAINMMADKGWKYVNICTTFIPRGLGTKESYMYALMEKTLKTLYPRYLAGIMNKHTASTIRNKKGLR